MSDNFFFALIITFILGINFQNTFRKVAKHVNLVDDPGDRKNETNAIPLSGGIAMFLALTFTALLLNDSILNLRFLFSGLMILIVVGVLYDLDEVSTSQRFFLQMLAAFIAFQWGGAQIIDLGHLLAEGKTLELRHYSLPFTLLAIFGVINTINIMNCVDGLAGSIALITCFLLSMLALKIGDISTFQLLGLVSTSLVSFLFYNWRFYVNQKALVHLGDAGGLFLGFVIAYFLIKLSQGDHRAIAPVTALWIFAFPVIDTLTTLIRRLVKGLSPLKPDGEHLHKLLLSAGIKPDTATFIIIFISILCAGFGLLGEHYHFPEHIMFYCFLLTFIGYYLMIRKAWKVRRFIKNTIKH